MKMEGTESSMSRQQPTKNVRIWLEMMNGELVKFHLVKTHAQANGALSVIRMQLKEALDGLSPIFGKDVLLAICMELMDEDDDINAPQTKLYSDHTNEQTIDFIGKDS